MSNDKAITLEQLFRYKRPWGQLPHQDAAIIELEEDLSANGYAVAMRRDRPWFKSWSQDGKQPDPIFLAPAQAIIKTWEGCKLAAYKCPAGVWTIGWGATTVNGAAVREGDKISQALADELLRAEILRIATELHQIIPAVAKWGGNQQAALISWAYNVGLGAVKDSTLRRRINAGEGGTAVIPQELPKWNKSNGAPLEGLTRRRAAEVELFIGKPPAQQQQPIKLSPSSHFSSAPPAPAHANPLPVAWENQNDNASGTGYRECFSSSCAMLARFWGKVANDDAYNVIRGRYGDSTNAQAQLAALRSLGLTANFATNGDRSDLEAEIKAGRPVAVGWLHHGSVSAPSGGGHWTVVIGYTESAAIHNDPNGEADLAAGGYTANTNGAGQHYSWKNWLPRWEADGPGSGWLLTCHP